MNIILQSSVRHLLSALAGSLIAIGIIDNDAHNFLTASEPIITGIILYVFAQGWSYLQKRKLFDKLSLLNRKLAKQDSNLRQID